MENMSEEILYLKDYSFDKWLEQSLENYKNNGLILPFWVFRNNEWWVAIHRFFGDITAWSIEITNEIIDQWKQMIYENWACAEQATFVYQWYMDNEWNKEEAIIVFAYDFVNKKIYEYGLMYRIVKKLLSKPVIEEIWNPKVFSVKDM